MNAVAHEGSPELLEASKVCACDPENGPPESFSDACGTCPFFERERELEQKNADRVRRRVETTREAGCYVLGQIEVLPARNPRLASEEG